VPALALTHAPAILVLYSICSIPNTGHRKERMGHGTWGFVHCGPLWLWLWRLDNPLCIAPSPLFLRPPSPRSLDLGLGRWMRSMQLVCSSWLFMPCHATPNYAPFAGTCRLTCSSELRLRRMVGVVGAGDFCVLHAGTALGLQGGASLTATSQIRRPRDERLSPWPDIPGVHSRGFSSIGNQATCNASRG
jgi:hypothetical protein